jgi:glycosyltransferase involved in cell wall biosynthesis
MAERHRACVVSTSSSVGGAEAYLARVVRGLGNDYDFTALVPPSCHAETQHVLREAGARLEFVDGLERLPTPRGINGVRRALARLRPSIVHANLTDQRDGATALIAAQVSHIPAIATLNLVLPTRKPVKEAFSRAVLRRANVVVAVSFAVGDYLHELGIDNRVVRYGISAPELDPAARSTLGIGPEEIVVGGIGRLDRQKGWDVLCEAALDVRALRPDVRFLVIGEGPEGESLRLPSGNAVEFVGYHANASSLVAAFDVLVVPSRYEAFGLVALEAMLGGVPVVAARTGGLAEVVEGAGCLVPSESPEALAAVLVEIVDNAERRSEMAVRGRARAEREFRLERMLDETRMLYESFCA